MTSLNAEGRGGQRGPENVWGSAATAAICAILAAYGPYDPTVFQVSEFTGTAFCNASSQ